MSPRERLRQYIRMRGAVDAGLVITSLSGMHLGVVDSQIRPLYGLIAVTFSRYRPLADGRYEAVSQECAFFTDLATGGVIDSFLNPYTGETVKVTHTRTRPARLIFNLDLSFTLVPKVEGFEIVHQVRSPVVIGDVFTMIEESTLKTSGAAPGRSFGYSEVNTMQVKLADLSASPQVPLRVQTAYTAVTSWRPWLMMGERQGHLLATGAGVLGLRMEELPAAWVQAAEVRHPDLVRNPGDLLQFPP